MIKHMDYIELGCQELSVRLVNHIFNLNYLYFCARTCACNGNLRILLRSQNCEIRHVYIYLKTQLEAT